MTQAAFGKTAPHEFEPPDEEIQFCKVCALMKGAECHKQSNWRERFDEEFDLCEIDRSGYSKGKAPVIVRQNEAVKEFIEKELQHLNRRCNEACEKIVERELRAQEEAENTEALFEKHRMADRLMKAQAERIIEKSRELSFDDSSYSEPLLRLSTIEKIIREEAGL